MAVVSCPAIIPFSIGGSYTATNNASSYQNFSIMSEYVSPLGRIKHREQTGLRPVNQRKIAKAIRRAMGLGLMPSVHRHPEILAAEMKAKMDGGFR